MRGSRELGWTQAKSNSDPGSVTGAAAASVWRQLSGNNVSRPPGGLHVYEFDDMLFLKNPKTFRVWCINRFYYRPQESVSKSSTAPARQINLLVCADLISVHKITSKQRQQ